MANYKKKEEERIERAIRALLKLPENRRCINCNSLGPQYVCITFLTFVCTNCSGIHREFTHRVKSVSIARFTAEEVAALEAAGNGLARQIYLRGYDPERHSFPDSSNLHKLREFIRQVYMDRRFSGDNKKVQRLKLSEDEAHQPRKTTSYNGNCRSPTYDNNFDPRSPEKSSPAGRGEPKRFKSVFEDRRSTSMAKDRSRGGGRRSTAFFEIVDNRVRSGSARRHEAVGFSPRSPECQMNARRSCSPRVAQSVQDGKVVGSSTQNQQKQKEGGNGGNLIDLSMEPEVENGGSAQHVSGNDDVSTMKKASSVQNVNSLEDLLFGLSVTTTSNVPDGSMGGNEAQGRAQHQPLASSVSLPLPNKEQLPSFDSFLAQNQTSSLAPDAATPSSGFTEQERPSAPPEVKASTRTELPVDLFANFPEPAPNWQVGPVHAMGYNSPFYQNPQPNSAKSINPFDINDQAPESQPPQFPSVDSTAMSRPPMMTPPSNSFASAGPQGISSVGPEREADPFASLMVNQKSTSKGGNPFG